MSLPIDSIISQRPVRSYVRREGRITKAQSRALEILWPKYGISENHSLLTLNSLFGDERPVTLEIGFGNGKNLVDLALTHPNHGYIGIDVYRPGAGQLMLELDRLDIGNVRILLQDAADVIFNRFSNHSFESILIYFPDPWPKKRHHKRRALGPNFLHQLALCLKPSGILCIATDCSNYAQNILELIALEPLLKILDNLQPDQNPLHQRTVTKYEARGIKLGNPIVNISAQRQ